MARLSRNQKAAERNFPKTCESEGQTVHKKPVQKQTIIRYENLLNLWRVSIPLRLLLNIMFKIQSVSRTRSRGRSIRFLLQSFIDYWVDTPESEVSMSTALVHWRCFIVVWERHFNRRLDYERYQRI